MPDLHTLLHSTFGHTHFRANQEAVCRAATAGRDCLLVMPTGAGKSLCYQLPALAREGTGLVISPLIALMDDQAQKLTAAGLNVGRIHSGLSREQSRQACRDYLDGKLHFLFIAPERMRVPGFPEMLAKRKPALIAIDEAHCISAWGHDFRPDYRTLGEHLPALRPSPIIALTATATPQVQKDIAAQLNLQQPALFIHGFRRDNLHIEVLELSKPQRSEFTAKFLAEDGRRPAIVYAPSRKIAEELAADLNRALKNTKPSAPFIASSAMSGVSAASPTPKTPKAAAYHAGLPAEQREQVQQQFQSGKLDIVVATIAFGMGIDKADVRTVVHYALPASVEAYYQEIGRAGRDGAASRTVLLYSFADRKMHDFFLERDYPVATELSRVARVLTDELQPPDELRQHLKMDAETFDKSVEKLASQGAAVIDITGQVRRGATTKWQSGYDLQVQHRRGQIDAMLDFAQTQQCRMTALIRHFGDLADAYRPCGHCDFCAPHATTAQSFNEPSAAQEIHLRTLLRTLASASKSTGKLHTELALTKERKDLDDLLDGLARAGLITLTTESFTTQEGDAKTYKRATITSEGRELMEADTLGVVLRTTSAATSKPSTKKKSRVPHSSQSHRDEWGRNGTGPADKPAFTPAQENLEAALRAWRKQEAAKTGKPAFIVFGDAVITAIVDANPQTLTELQTVKGLGPAKIDQYGAHIIAICRNPDSDALPLLTPAKTRHPERSSSASSTNAIEESRKGSERPIRPKLSNHQPASPDRPIAQDYKDRGAILLTEVEIAKPTHPADPTRTLNPAQQALELRLREWRKLESEKIGLPQFFILGTTTLRSIALETPTTLDQLKHIPGIDSEKLTRFGPALLALCGSI